MTANSLVHHAYYIVMQFTLKAPLTFIITHNIIYMIVQLQQCIIYTYAAAASATKPSLCEPLRSRSKYYDVPVSVHHVTLESNTMDGGACSPL